MIIENINLEFCEPLYVFNKNLPQFFSAITHFPYIPFFFLLMYYIFPEFIPGFNFNIIKLCLIQSSVQLITMGGHLVDNPYLFFIPQLSAILTIYWIYYFSNITTTIEFQISKKILIISFINMLLLIFFFGLISSIFLNFLMLIIFIRKNNLFNKLSKKAKYFMFLMYFISFIILGIELYFCNNLLKIGPLIPWHIFFDLLFWQINGTIIIMMAILSNENKLIKNL